MTKLVLASGSKSRAKVLRNAGVEFTVSPADVDEPALRRKYAVEKAGNIALRLAEAKALQVSRRMPDALVLGADQLLVLDHEILGKSADMAAAAALLRRLRGKPHELLNGVALAQDGKVVWVYLDKCRLVMRDFSDAFLDDYLARAGEAVLGGVGCYQLEGLGAQLFDHIDGDYFSILGLPLVPILSGLRKFGAVAT